MKKVIIVALVGLLLLTGCSNPFTARYDRCTKIAEDFCAQKGLVLAEMFIYSREFFCMSKETRQLDGEYYFTDKEDC